MTQASQSCVCSDIKRSREIAGTDVLDCNTVTETRGCAYL
jgi:hypothetical protein